MTIYSGTTTLTVECAFADLPTAAAPTWTDITADVLSFECTYGRNDDLDTYQAGTGTLVLDDSARTYDPTNTGGSWYGNLLPKRRIRVSATYSATTYRLFDGFVEEWAGVVWRPPASAYRTIRLTDATEVLANATVTAWSAGTVGLTVYRTDEIVTAVLDAISWPAARRTISTDGRPMVLPPVGKALDLLRLCERTEQGRLYLDPNGYVVFRSRAWNLTNGTSSAATFGDQSGDVPAEMPAGQDQAAVRIRNLVTVTSDYATSGSASDATSQGSYFTRSLEVATTLAWSEETAQVASWLLGRYKDPVDRIPAIELSAVDVGATAWAQIFARGIGDRITVRRQPQSTGNVVSFDAVIERISHRISNDTWVTSFGLAPAIVPSGTTFLRADGAGSTTSDGPAVAAP